MNQQSFPLQMTKLNWDRPISKSWLSKVRMSKPPIRKALITMLTVVTGLISRIPAGNIGSSDTLLISYVVDTPPEDISAGQLISEIGRREAR